MSDNDYYKRTKEFDPRTRANGLDVEFELDAISAAFDKIPAPRDDGQGYDGPIHVGEATAPTHAVQLQQMEAKLGDNTENANRAEEAAERAEEARDIAIEKARQSGEARDEALEASATVTNIHREQLEKALGVNARVYPRLTNQNLKVGDVIPAPEDTADGLPITHLIVDGNAYAMSPIATGSVTAIGANSATIGGVQVLFLSTTPNSRREYKDVNTLKNSSDFFPLNTFIYTTSHTQNGIGGAKYIVVDTASVTPDNMRVIQSISQPNISFVLWVDSVTYLEQWGLVDGGDIYPILTAATNYIRSISDNDRSKRVAIECRSSYYVSSGTLDFYPFQAPLRADKEAVIFPMHSNNYCTRVAPSAYDGALGSVPVIDRQPQAWIENLTIVNKNGQRAILIDSDAFNPGGTLTYLSYLGLQLNRVQPAAENQPTAGQFFRGYELGQNAYEVTLNNCISWYQTEHFLGKDVSASPNPPNTGVGINLNNCYFIYANESVVKQRGFTLISNQWKVNVNGGSLLHLHEHAFLQNGASLSLVNTRVEGARKPEGAGLGQPVPLVDGWVKIVSGGKFSMVGGDMINYLDKVDLNFKAPFFVQSSSEAAQAQINMISVDTYGCRGTEFATIGGVWVAFDGAGSTADINIRDNYRRHPTSFDDDPLLISINNRGEEKDISVDPLSIVARNSTDGDGTGVIGYQTSPANLGFPTTYRAIRLQKDGANNSVLCVPFRMQDPSKQVSFGFYAKSSVSVPYSVYFCNMLRDFSSFRKMMRYDKLASELSGSINAADWTPFYGCTQRPVGGYEYAVIEFDLRGLPDDSWVDVYGLVVNNFR
ncbi:hypothetical protein ACPD0L_000729 [Vibrio cholerae]